MAAPLRPSLRLPGDGPIYLAIRSTIEERIASGAYPAGSALPSENQLAEEFATTRITVRNAMNSLVEAGIVRRIRGKGTFVSEPASTPTAPLKGFREIARSRDAVPTVRVLTKGRRLAGPLYADLFEVKPTDELYSIRRVNVTNDIPISIECTVVPLSRVPGVEHRDVSVFSLFETYAMDGHAIVASQETIGVARLCARDAAVLRAEPNAPALTLEVVGFDEQGLAVEHVEGLLVAERAAYEYVF